MVLSDPKSTKLNVRDDRPTAITSSAHGSNIDAIGFNVAFLAARNPKLALSILKLYEEAHSIQASDEQAPEEDFAMFATALNKILADTSPHDEL
jgi:hypothetical protein